MLLQLAREDRGVLTGRTRRTSGGPGTGRWANPGARCLDTFYIGKLKGQMGQIAARDGACSYA